MSKQEWMARALLLLTRILLAQLKHTNRNAYDEYRVEAVNSRSEFELTFETELGRPRDLYDT